MASASPASTSSRKRLISIAAALAAFALLGFVIHRNGGVATIAGVVGRLGYRWPLLLVPYGFTALATIMAYRSCLPRRGRDVPFPVLVQIERSGSALNAFLPLGDSSGTIIKVALLRHWFTSDEIIAAQAWSSLATGIGNGLAGIGALLAYAIGALPLAYALPLAGISFAMMLPSITAMFLVRRGLAVKAATGLSRLPIDALRRRREGLLEWARNLDRNVASAVGSRARDFLHVFGWRTFYQAVRIGELWLVITLLHLPGGVGAALAYNAMSRAVQQLFSFVPGRMGVVEGLAAMLSKALSWESSAGVAMSLTLRFTYFVNLFLAGSALSGSHALSVKYPPRSADELRAERLAKALP